MGDEDYGLEAAEVILDERADDGEGTRTRVETQSG